MKTHATNRILTIQLKDLRGDFDVLLSNLHAPNIEKDRLTCWEDLRLIGDASSSGNWIIGGNFNTIYAPSHKSGGRSLKNSGSFEFRRMCADLFLVDITPKYGWFTWRNKHIGEDNIKCRLDRFLINSNWLLLAANFHSKVVHFRGSNHWPISMIISINHKPRGIPFKMESFWYEHEGFREALEGWWNMEVKGNNRYKRIKKLGEVKNLARAWKKFCRNKNLGLNGCKRVTTILIFSISLLKLEGSIIRSPKSPYLMAR